MFCFVTSFFFLFCFVTLFYLLLNEFRECYRKVKKLKHIVAGFFCFVLLFIIIICCWASKRSWNIILLGFSLVLLLRYYYVCWCRELKVLSNLHERVFKIGGGSSFFRLILRRLVLTVGTFFCCRLDSSWSSLFRVVRRPFNSFYRLFSESMTNLYVRVEVPRLVRWYTGGPCCFFFFISSSLVVVVVFQWVCLHFFFGRLFDLNFTFVSYHLLSFLMVTRRKMFSFFVALFVDISPSFLKI